VTHYRRWADRHDGGATGGFGPVSVERFERGGRLVVRVVEAAGGLGPDDVEAPPLERLEERSGDGGGP
jgi:hypothetical protein